MRIYVEYTLKIDFPSAAAETRFQRALYRMVTRRKLIGSIGVMNYEIRGTKRAKRKPNGDL